MNDKKFTKEIKIIFSAETKESLGYFIDKSDDAILHLKESIFNEHGFLEYDFIREHINIGKDDLINARRAFYHRSETVYLKPTKETLEKTGINKI